MGGALECLADGPLYEGALVFGELFGFGGQKRPGCFRVGGHCLRSVRGVGSEDSASCYKSLVLRVEEKGGRRGGWDDLEETEMRWGWRRDVMRVLRRDLRFLVQAREKAVMAC